MAETSAEKFRSDPLSDKEVELRRCWDQPAVHDSELPLSLFHQKIVYLKSATSLSGVYLHRHHHLHWALDPDNTRLPSQQFPRKIRPEPQTPVPQLERLGSGVQTLTAAECWLYTAADDKQMKVDQLAIDCCDPKLFPVQLCPQATDRLSEECWSPETCQESSEMVKHLSTKIHITLLELSVG